MTINKACVENVGLDNGDDNPGMKSAELRV